MLCIVGLLCDNAFDKMSGKVAKNLNLAIQSMRLLFDAFIVVDMQQGYY